ncbi:MAG: TIM-barrel domain-containing protein [Luteolibacter sp.]
MNFPFIPVNGFTPNNPGWSSVGNIDNWTADASGQNFTFVFGSRSLVIQILGPTAFRLRFNPASGATYGYEVSTAVVTRDLGLAGLTVNHSQPSPSLLMIETGGMTVKIGLAPFTVQVLRNGQLIHQDAPGQGVLYIPGQEVIAVMKTAPPGAGYYGLGEKAGSQFAKNGFTFTFFNFDNFTYNGPSLGEPGPLNPTEPLYCSIPVLIENNPFPSGSFGGAPYATGLFLDNPAQTYANVSANDYSDMSGKYYLGSLYNELDYYFFTGNAVPDVLAQYTTLTGRGPMPPRYAFGLHQGAYGYYDRYKLAQAANAYRAARIPCDGLHIDVDFQDNYRTFTHSEMKFPDAKELFDDLHGIGFKLSTNITPIITSNELNQEGVRAPYSQRDALVGANALIYNTRFNGGESPNLYDGGVNYGNNRGNNPYPSPPLQFNRNGLMPLSAPGNYPDFGLASVRQAWGEQYEHLLQDVGLDMIWQDMTCPAIDPNLPPGNEDYKTFPQDLMMAREATLTNGTVQVDYLPNAKLHNSYVNNLLDATWNGINTLQPTRRNFIIARGGYAGMQRYAGLWTGDSSSNWDFLAINLPEVLNLGLSGVPISGCDIGGFATSASSSVVGGSIVGGVTNYELLTRWMHLGAFLPWFRNHYDGYNKQFQEPFAYAEPVPTNCRKYVELRYRMMQVQYDAMYRWTQTGLPVARPLFLNDPQDPGVYGHLNDQFYVGDDFLVAPILTQHETASPPTSPVRGIYLPSGSDWYAFMDNTAPLAAAVTGGTYISNYYADLTLVPIYIRAGAILPFSNLEQWVGQLDENPLTINCYPGPDRWTDPQSYQLYQDDGITTDARNGGFRLSRIYQQTVNSNGSVQRQLRIARVTGTYTPPTNYLYVAILGSITSANQVTRDGSVLPNVGDPHSLEAAMADAWYWNASLNIVFVKIFDNRADTTVIASY